MRPGQLTLASVGPAATLHIALERFRRAAGSRVRPVFRHSPCVNARYWAAMSRRFLPSTRSWWSSCNQANCAVCLRPRPPGADPSISKIVSISNRSGHYRRCRTTTKKNRQHSGASGGPGRWKRSAGSSTRASRMAPRLPRSHGATISALHLASAFRHRARRAEGSCADPSCDDHVGDGCGRV
jgi:hypothetical protein